MPRRDRWTFVVLRDDLSSPTQHRVSSRAIRGALAVLALLVVALVGLAHTLGVRGSERVRAERLAREKALLAAELADLRERVDGLDRALAELTTKDERYRLIAGLPPIPDEIRRVGIGGPGTGVPEETPLWTLDPEVGERVFALSYDLHALSRRARLLSESLREATDSLRAHRHLLEATPSILPAAGLLTSGFSRARRHPIHNRTLPHEGIDISAPAGTPILAAADGRVTFVGWKSGYGQMVEVDHGHGFVTRYAHASRVLVRRGETVERGEAIALVGRTGLATAPNLHYEILVDGRPVNPLSYVITGALPD